jgi:hypothetical protein
MPPVTPSPTARALHTLLEVVLAGPQHARSGTIRLRVDAGPSGPAVTTVAEPAVRLDADGLAGPAATLAWGGLTTAGAAAARIGVDPGRAAVYHDTSGLAAGDALHVDPDEIAGLLDWYVAGAVALGTLAPEAAPVLWPEHADLAITVDEVNYGVSPGDGFSAEPYAYVGPWTVPDDPFFGAPFGAVRTRSQAPDADAVAAFFAEGRRVAGTAAGRAP